MATPTLSKEMLEAHPWPAQIDRDVLARCIDVDLRKSVRLCLDCADVCDATGRLLTRQTEYAAATARAQVSSYRELCAACAEERERHAQHHEHCRICAEECRRCEEACSAVVDAIS
jgi:hypothetical protein